MTNEMELAKESFEQAETNTFWGGKSYYMLRAIYYLLRSIINYGIN